MIIIVILLPTIDFYPDFVKIGLRTIITNKYSIGHGGIFDFKFPLEIPGRKDEGN